MVDTSTIVLIVLALIAGLIMYKVTKSIIKAIFLAISVITIVSAAAGFFIISDAVQFQENFASTPSMFLYQDQQEEIVAGFSGIFTEQAAPDFISSERIGSYDSYYNDQNPDQILADNFYKLFIVKKPALDSVDQITQGIEMSSEEAFSIISSDDAISGFVSYQYPDLSGTQAVSARQQVMQGMDIQDDAQMKGALFAALLSSAMQKQGPLYIFEEYKQGNIIIYPETAMFKLLKRVPLSIVSAFMRGETDGSS